MIYQDSKLLLEVRGLRAEISGTEIVKGIDLAVRSGEVHAISPASTFRNVLLPAPLASSKAAVLTSACGLVATNFAACVLPC